MLWIGDITYWAGWPERRIETVINTQRMSKLFDLTDIALTGTRFLYSEWTEHKRGDLRTVEVRDTIANVLTAMGTDPFEVYFTVNIYPKDDINLDPEEFTFRLEDFDRLNAANQDLYPGCSWLWMVLNETKRKRYLIDMLPQTFVDLVETGTTTTTTTSTDRQD